MDFIDHPQATSTDVELEPYPDGTILHVLVVYTPLALADVEPGYDGEALSDLIKSVQTYIRETGAFHNARIRRAKS